MRYLPLTPQDRTDMLAKIGAASVDDLFANVPKAKLLKGLTDLPRAKGELEVERIMGAMAAENISASEVPFFVGAGAYKHHVPASVDHLIQRVGVPDQLHALPARDRPGHAAVSLRVPDAGRHAHRHGGGECLHV